MDNWFFGKHNRDLGAGSLLGGVLEINTFSRLKEAGLDLSNFPAAGYVVNLGDFLPILLLLFKGNRMNFTSLKLFDMIKNIYFVFIPSSWHRSSKTLGTS